MSLAISTGSFTISYCWLTISYCWLTISYCWLTISYCWLTIGYCWLTIGYCWLTIGYCKRVALGYPQNSPVAIGGDWGGASSAPQLARSPASSRIFGRFRGIRGFGEIRRLGGPMEGSTGFDHTPPPRVGRTRSR